MDPILFARWYHTLPAHRQIRCALHTPTGYCCLGWATEVVRGPAAWYSHPVLSTFYVTDANGYQHSTMPPADVSAALGFDLVITGTRPNNIIDQQTCLTTTMPLDEFLSGYNDAGYSFDFIRRLAASILIGQGSLEPEEA